MEKMIIILYWIYVIGLKSWKVGLHFYIKFQLAV
jgi:hypothetical protein